MPRPSQLLLRRFPVNQSPLDHRESRKLLDYLTSTFRRHLDNGRPVCSPLLSVQAQTEPPDKHKDEDLLSLQGVTKADVNTGGGIRADRHLRSILLNPLMSQAPDRLQPAPAVARDPMDVFDRSVALGSMSMKGAELCLKAKKLQIISTVPAYCPIPISKHLDSHRIVRTGMKESDAGRRVLRHLLASGLVEKYSFWANQHLTPILTLYLAAEGLQEHVWYALSRLAEDIKMQRRPRTGRPEGQQTAFHHLLCNLVTAEAWGCEDLDAACSCLLRAEGLIRNVDGLASVLNIQGTPWTLFKIILGRMNFREKLQVSPTILTSVIELFDADVRLQYPSALLQMLHPSEPSAEKALKALHGKVQNPTPGKKAMLRLGLVTASFLKERRDFNTAKYVLVMLAKMYPRDLGIFEDDSDCHDKGEETLANLLRLEGLGVA